MPELTIPTTSLADGTPFPLLGLGTGSPKGPDGAEVVAAALREGYRLVDTAAQYGNEAAVGEGIRRSGVDPAEVLVTTKIAGGDQGREAARQGFAESLRRLGLPSAALLLIHWPNPSRGLALDTWRTLIDLKEEGLAQHIGVSNFRPEQLQELFDATGVWPEVNQIQLSPALPRPSALAFHREHGIVTEAEVDDSLRRLSAVVDEQNAGDPNYEALIGADGPGVAYRAARALIVEGASQPNGYTEPILHRMRREKLGAPPQV